MELIDSNLSVKKVTNIWDDILKRNPAGDEVRLRVIKDHLQEICGLPTFLINDSDSNIKSFTL